MPAPFPSGGKAIAAGLAFARRPSPLLAFASALLAVALPAGVDRLHLPIPVDTPATASIVAHSALAPDAAELPVLLNDEGLYDGEETSDEEAPGTVVPRLLNVFGPS